MLLDDYTKQNTSPSTPPKKKPKKNGNSSVPSMLSVVVLSGLIGFFGGLFAVRVTPDIAGTSQAITERVVIGQGEIIADIVEDVAPSVVSIDVTSVETTFNPFFGSGSFEAEGAGTGIILTSDGLIVTNDHVIPDNVTQVSVVLNDGTSYDEVEVIGREPFNDIAYLQLNGVDNLTPAQLGDSDDVRVGQQVIAIGNALGEFDTTVTSGIISGQGRPIIAGSGRDSELLTNLFQTDASINPGNSGGPLLNIDGEVVAINTAVAGNAENIGFAIPINDVKPGIASIERNNELVRPYLGVRYITLTPAIAEEFEVTRESGALIFDETDDGAILDGSPAEKAGLRNGDIIISVNGTELSEDLPLPNVVSRFQVDETITVLIERDGNEQEVEVTLERVPENF